MFYFSNLKFANLVRPVHVAPNVVQRRLGHKNISITLDVYGHCVPSMQQDAAKRLGALLHG